ncbi:MAG: hypothetical protein M0R80_08870 [Proteobacteria bacterium]|jgi:hypothetical protein|nr:hypothetical protein [Pseudomonadota bacterium]
MNFKQWIESFRHPSNVPVDFAMAIYKIFHNQADYPEWETLDSYQAHQDPVFDWINAVLQANGVEDTKKEIDWFKMQLAKGRN